MLKRYRVITALTITLISFHAEDVSATFAVLQDAEPNDFFGPYEVNSFLVKHSSGDDTATEVNVSMRYYFKDSSDAARATILGFEPFLAYTAKADFYWFGSATRDSAPVISRYQNPGIHFRRNSQDIARLDWFDIAIEHFSNGQSLDASKNEQLVLDAYQTGDQSVMDSISRVAAAAAITTQLHWKFSLPVINKESHIDLKWYIKRFDQEADVFWGPHASEDLDFNDFQIIRLQWVLALRDRPFFSDKAYKGLPIRFYSEVNMGSKGLSEDSWNFMLNLPTHIPYLGVIPFAITGHLGPINNMSDYTRSQNSVAGGIALVY